MSQTHPATLSPSVPSGPFSLFLDVDGTLLDIAARPGDVDVPRSLTESLAKLAANLDGAIALVSGREIADLDRLFAPLRLRASGVHGAELRFAPEADVQISAEHALSADTITALRGITERYPGTLLEDKRFSVAIHYRAVPASGPSLRMELDAFLQSGLGRVCRILPGRMVFEVKRSGFDKGSAIRTLQAQPPFHGRMPIFIGDDVTDLPGFQAVLESGGVPMSVTIARPGVSVHFPDPQAVRTWLAEAASATAS